MKLQFKIAIVAFLIVAVAAVFWAMIKNYSFDVLQPAGGVAQEQLDLIVFASLLSLIVIIPVFVMTFFIVWKYRVTNPRAGAYKPNWASSKLAEAIWWGIPILLILILGVTIFISSHRLDPYRERTTNVAPLKVQVIALEWRWLFIYPEQGIASINYLHIPVDRPINFQITADAPMNSFWIPKLGGQVYAMNGMSTKLHLDAHTTGDFTGKSANISGEGYSDMTFRTHVSEQAEFDAWITQAQMSQGSLTLDTYESIAKPSVDKTEVSYRLTSPEVYDTVIMKYMMPSTTKNNAEHQHD